MRIASANADASRSGTMTPVRPCSTTGPMPPAGVVMSGVPDAIVSSTMLGRPSTLPLSSRTEGIATRSAVASQAATSSCERLPRNLTR